MKKKKKSEKDRQITLHFLVTALHFSYCYPAMDKLTNTTAFPWWAVLQYKRRLCTHMTQWKFFAMDWTVCALLSFSPFTYSCLSKRNHNELSVQLRSCPKVHTIGLNSCISSLWTKCLIKLVLRWLSLWWEE